MANDMEQLTNQRIDYLVDVLKGAAGIVPFGSLIAEAVGVAIPKQRIDRMAEVVRALAKKVDAVGISVEELRERFQSPEFIDILEEGLLQAGKALSPERRQNIANILANGLTESELQHQRIKKLLLLLLADLTDPEVIFLEYASVSRPTKDDLFVRYANILREPAANMDAPLAVHDKRALQEAWRRHLVQLGLTTVDRPGRNDVTSLGRMLLRYLNAPEPKAEGAHSA
jgi:hypothetical protein